jgi:peptidoglycan/LPS O-acetylase OafA/YrhL
MQGAINATVSVDTFFLMSGLLVTYLLLRESDRSKGRFNVPLFYIHRYLRWIYIFIQIMEFSFDIFIINFFNTRLTPVYAIILGFIATLLIYVSTGPNWQMVAYMKEGCRSNWWNNLLYVNNYVHYPSDIEVL